MLEKIVEDPFELLAASARNKPEVPYHHKLLCAFRKQSKEDERRRMKADRFWSCAQNTPENVISFQVYGR